MKIKRLEKEHSKEIATLVCRVMESADQLPLGHTNIKCYSMLYELIKTGIEENALLIYGMIKENLLIGIVGYEPLSNEITYLYVLPEYQRQGIGSKLLDCIMGGIKQQKVKLRAHRDAIPMYTKYGFERNNNDNRKSIGMIYTIRR